MSTPDLVVSKLASTSPALTGLALTGPGWTRLNWAAMDELARNAALQRPQQLADADQRHQVERLIAQVRSDGDSTCRALTRRFDQCEIDQFLVPDAEFERAEARLDEALKQAIRNCHARIVAFHRATQPMPVALQTAPGVHCERLVVPIQRVGLYVPAGTAPLPSTALMLGVPARLANVPHVLLCSPPRADGCVHASVLYAARLCGIRHVYRLGGVQAIAAMAYGTESIAKCDKIFGPGNSWVTLAKQLVAQDPAGAAIDMPAGPSELLVIADASADARFVAADLLSQAEHGSDSQVLLLTHHAPLLAAVERELELQLQRLPRAELARAALRLSRAILVPDLAQAVEISNRYAPEHLILNVEQPRYWLQAVSNAGSVFLGPHTPESVGDYCSGTNHVLPTAGHARALSGVSVASFVKLMTVQSLSFDGLRNIGPDAIALAEAEGLDAHAQAVRVRLEAA